MAVFILLKIFLDCRKNGNLKVRSLYLYFTFAYLTRCATYSWNPASIPLPEAERGFDFCSPTLQGLGLGVRFERKSHMAFIYAVFTAPLTRMDTFTTVPTGSDIILQH
jgi:hypothetical protein